MYPLSTPTSRWYYALRWSIILMLGLIIYYQTFRFGFVFDDNLFIVDNPHIKNFSNINGMWSEIPKTRMIGIYSFAINYFFHQLNPQGYHIFNLIIHLICVGLVWALSSLIFKITKSMQNDSLQKELPFFIALLFLVHPGQTQAVTYITQRFESIATLFYLGSIYCYLRGRILSNTPKRTAFFISSVFLAFCGIFTKETAVTIPFMIIAFELILWPKNYSRTLESSKKIILLLIGSILFTLILMKLLKTGLISYLNYTTPSNSHDGDITTLGNYLLTQLRVFLTFLRLLILPINQNVDYDYVLSSGLLKPPLTFIGACLITTFVYIIIKTKNTFPLIALGLTWILITFSINLAPRPHLIFEHKLYLISFGFFLSSVSFIHITIRNKKLLAIFFIGILCIFTVLSFKRNKAWASELTLWEDTIQKSPHKERVLANLGRAYALTQHYEQAIIVLSKAIAMNERNYKSYLNRGYAYEQIGLESKALEDFNKSIEINPDHFVAYLQIAKIYKKQKNTENALNYLNKVITLAPKFQYGYIERGFLFLDMNQKDSAFKDFNVALQIAPHDPEALNGRAMFYGATGQLELAIKDLTQILNLDPQNALILKNRGLCLLKLGRQQEALNDLVKSWKINPNDEELKSMLIKR